MVEMQRYSESIRPINIKRKYIGSNHTNNAESKITWFNIANCVNHEMYPKLGSAIRAIVNKSDINNGGGDDAKIGLYDLESKHIKIMTAILKEKRNLGVEERNYLKKLIERALDFFSTGDGEKRYNAFNGSVHSTDFDVKVKSLNRTVIQDIFDVHRYFKFCNYHFDEYSLEQFRNDVLKFGGQYLGKQF
eukprot:533733_1